MSHDGSRVGDVTTEPLYVRKVAALAYARRLLEPLVGRQHSHRHLSGCLQVPLNRPWAHTRAISTRAGLHVGSASIEGDSLRWICRGGISAIMASIRNRLTYRRADTCRRQAIHLISALGPCVEGGPDGEDAGASRYDPRGNAVRELGSGQNTDGYVVGSDVGDQHG